ncbi:hypothetical protein FH972_021314 [Carpinus fangiana]|uniref:Zn(2)-C6 fungal-type domain-containing protein n=1 Tax=Carpinus fangiana TaxID=176857 RepID=A0A5N6KPL1_9ROSI|nr:hypothetical protein FH972_021314 [Carpinus fangiana]
MTGARPLLPANLHDLAAQQQYNHPHGGDPDQASSSLGAGGGGGGKGGPGGKPTYAKRGKITIVACVPCRRRKTKCDGKRPSCGQCASRDSQCQYDMTDDQRKLTYLRDNVEHLQEKSSVLEGLLFTVQTANEEEAVEIFRRLRSGTDVQHVAEQVQAGRLLSGVGRRESARSEQSATDADLARVRQYDQLMQQMAVLTATDTNDVLRRIRNGEDVGTILDAINSGNLSPLRLVRASPEKIQATLESDFSNQEQAFGIVKGAALGRTHAAPGSSSEFAETSMKGQWTDVTQDAELVEYLLTLYFTWQHSFFQSFPEKLFRNDYENGRTKYCSPMLVNAICAAGCFLADPAKIKERLPDNENLADRFYEAAVKLLDAAQHSAVTTTAALYLISYFEGTRGRLSNLWMFSGRSSLMAIDIDLHLKRAFRDIEDPEKRQEAQNERKARCHAFWGAFHVDQITSFTLGRLPNINSHGVTQDPPEIDEDEDKELWWAPEFGTLPHRPGAKSSTFSFCASLSKVVNGTLLMFFAPLVPLSGSLLVDEYDKYLDWYHTLPLNIRNAKDAPPHVLCLHMYYWVAILHLFRPFLKATIHNSDISPREVCRQAANNISDLMHEHARLYQRKGIYMFQVHCLLSACTIHIINIPSIQATRQFTEACNTFQELIPGNEWARSCLHVLRNLVEKWNLILPLEAEEALCRDQYSQKSVSNTSSLSDVPRLLHATDPSTVFGDINPRERDQTSIPGQEPQRHSDQGAGSPSRHQKRSSSSTPGHTSDSPVRVPPPGPPKRQRIMAQNLYPTDSTSPAPGSGPATSTRIQRAAENYLYTPLAGHTPPMLTPVGSSNPAGSASSSALGTRGTPTRRLPTGRAPPGRVGSAVGSESTGSTLQGGLGTRDSNEMRQEQNAAHGDARSTTDVVETGESVEPVVPPGGIAIERSARRERQARNSQGQPGTEVEGLSFGDDWRDPFMGFLGHQEE